MAAITTFNRAKIFQPFDALPGLREALAQKEWEHENLQNMADTYHNDVYRCDNEHLWLSLPDSN